MTVTLELSPNVKRAIERKAKRQRMTTAEYLQRTVEKVALPTRTRKSRPNALVIPASEKTGAEVLAELKALDIPKGYGDPAIDSHELARQLAARMSRSEREWRR